MSYFDYILRSEKDGSYYVGSTQNLQERLKRRNQGRSKSTKAKRPWQLLYSEAHSDRSAAATRENQIKRRKSRGYIDFLVRASRR